MTNLNEVQVLGEIKIFGGKFTPEGWAVCNGQELTISDYQALYNLLGTTYGGNGQTTFALPNLQGRAVIGHGQGTGLSIYNLGSFGGQTSVTLSTAELPAHHHNVVVSTEDAIPTGPGIRYPYNCLLAAPTPSNSSSDFEEIALYLPDSAPNITPVSLNANTMGNTGGGKAHNNMQPYFVGNYIICIEGHYPSLSY